MPNCTRVNGWNTGVLHAALAVVTGALSMEYVALAAESPVRVTVEVARPGWQISKYLTGMHFVYAFERDSLYADQRVADWMRRARVGLIRWPGGTAVQHYHWDNLNGIAFQVDSWDPKYKETPAAPTDYMDLDEYVAFCRRVGAEPMVGINLLSGKKYHRRGDSLAEARRLVTYCRDHDYGVKHWYLGNECYRGWSADAYAKEIDRYAEVLKSVDPSITIIGDWKFGPEKKHRFEQTKRIALASKHLDVMEIHEKWGGQWGLAMTGGHTFAEWQAEAGLYGGKLGSYTARFFEAMAKAGKDVKLGFNEWGVQVKDAASLFQVALVKADYLIDMFRQPVYSACDWNLNMGPGKSRLLRTADNGHRLVGFHPATKVFELCAAAQGRRHLPLTSSDPLVYGFAALDSASGAVQLYLLNKRSQSVLVELTLAGASTPVPSLIVESFVEPGDLKRSEVRPTAGKAGTTVQLPALSFTRLATSPSS